MTWRNETRFPNKRYWEGSSDWPPEICQRTRDNAAAIGWSASDWAACRNAGGHYEVDDWFDDLPAFESAVPAVVVAEMVSRYKGGDHALVMLEALAAGVAPCFAWLVNDEVMEEGDTIEYWNIAQFLGISGLDLNGWWHTGLFQVSEHTLRGWTPASTIAKRVTPWIAALGPHAYLWHLAGHSLREAKVLHKAGTVSEADLRGVVRRKGIKLPRNLNDHRAPKLRQVKPSGWELNDGQWKFVWTKEGWPSGISRKTRQRAETAGWTSQDWVRFHTASTDRVLDEWLTDLPAIPPSFTPSFVQSIIDSAQNGVIPVQVLNAVAGGVPVGFATAGIGRWRDGWYDADHTMDQISKTWSIAQSLGLSDQEATGWLLTGQLIVAYNTWKIGSAVDTVGARIGPWRKYGPTAYLFVLAGLGLREAAKAVKQPGWDDQTLRVMLALNGVVLPPGI